MRVLFVDDEPRVLTGIENALFFAEKGWEVEFATSGTEAVSRLASARYDVLVTDMKMPGLTGADVLEQATKMHPGIVKIVLSGEVEPVLAERGMPLAHEFVSKPCQPDELLRTIDRVHGAALALDNATLRTTLGALTWLPAQPRLHLQIQQALDSGAGAVDVAELIESDLAIASTVIRMANSVFYGFRTPVKDLRDAVVRLGGQTIGGIVLSAEIATWASPEVAGDVVALNGRSTLIAGTVRRMIGDEIDQAALAGLLHDVGILVLLGYLPEEYRMLQAALERGEQTGEALEREIFGASHAEIGACMLEMWNTDPVIVEVARHHHTSATVGLGDEARTIIDSITAVDCALDSGVVPPPNLAPHVLARAQELVGTAGQGVDDR